MSAIAPLRLKIPEAAEALRMSRARLYQKIVAGEIAVQKDGRSVFILPAELHRYVEQQTKD